MGQNMQPHSAAHGDITAHRSDPHHRSRCTHALSPLFVEPLLHADEDAAAELDGVTGRLGAAQHIVDAHVADPRPTAERVGRQHEKS